MKSALHRGCNTKHLVFVLLFLALFGELVLADDQRALFLATRAMDETDAVAACWAMVASVEQGFASAMDRVGHYHRQGVGTHRDLQKAHHRYTRAETVRRRWSTASLARVEIDPGLDLTARHRLEKAMKDGKPGVDRPHTTALIDGKPVRVLYPKPGDSTWNDRAIKAT